MESWRVIHHPAGDAAWNMAVDETLLRSYESGNSLPTLRFYGWSCPSISLGRFQRVDGSLDRSYCESNDIPVVRRPTGGRAVLHGADLTFTVVQPNAGGSVQDSYHKLSTAIYNALLSAGVPVQTFTDASDVARMRSVANCFDLNARFEIALDGRKVLGCAQLRTATAILQQNSLLLTQPPADNLNAFVDCRGYMGGTCISQYTEDDAILSSICRSIEHVFDCSLVASGLTPEEEHAARRFVTSKYATCEWNLNGASAVVDM